MCKCFSKCISNYFGIGELNSFYYFILYSMIAKFVSNLILDFDTIYSTKNSKKSIFQINPVLSEHILIKSLYKYLSFMFFSIILFCYVKIKTRKKEKNETVKKRNKTTNKKKKPINGNNSLIYDETVLISKVDPSKFMRFCFLYVFFLELIEITYYLGFYDFDLWAFNIVFSSIFMTILLKIKIFSHQIISLGSIVIVNLVSNIWIASLPEENNGFHIVNILFGNKYFGIIFYLLYIFNSFLISYARTFGKLLMEQKYIPLYQISFFIGLAGFCLISVCLFFTSIFQCHEDYNTKEQIQFCKIFDKEKISYYFDSFFVYFSKLKYKKENESFEFWLEVILITPLQIFVYFVVFNFEILLIYYFNPIYILVGDSLYYGFLKLVSFLFSVLSLSSLNYKTLIINTVADILAFFNYMIYLEVIQLKFCRLNENTRITIIERGILDSKTSDLENSQDEDSSGDYSYEEEDSKGSVDVKMHLDINDSQERERSIEMKIFFNDNNS